MASMVPASKAASARTQAERSEKAEARLIRAALELIGEEGTHRVTLRAIGERAGYSRGLVNYHFGSKEELLRKASRQLVDSWYARRLEPAIGDRIGLEALRALIDAHLATLGNPEARAYYMLVHASLGPMPELREELAEVHVGVRERMAQMIREGIEAGTIRPEADPEQQAILLYAAIRGLVYQWLIDPEAIDLRRAYVELADNVEHALAARRP